MNNKKIYLLLMWVAVVIGVGSIVAEILTKADLWVYMFLVSIALLCVGVAFGWSAYKK